MALPTNKGFWWCLGGAVVIVALAFSYRIAMGADFEAKTKDASVTLREGARQLEEGTKALREENERLKQQSAALSAQMQQVREVLAKVQAACPEAKEALGSLPSLSTYKQVGVSEQTMRLIFNNAEGARTAATSIEDYHFRVFPKKRP